MGLDTFVCDSCGNSYTDHSLDRICELCDAVFCTGCAYQCPSDQDESTNSDSETETDSNDDETDDTDKRKKCGMCPEDGLGDPGIQKIIKQLKVVYEDSYIEFLRQFLNVIKKLGALSAHRYPTIVERAKRVVQDFLDSE